jgi:hypothetical protein
MLFKTDTIAISDEILELLRDDFNLTEDEVQNGIEFTLSMFAAFPIRSKYGKRMPLKKVQSAWLGEIERFFQPEEVWDILHKIFPGIPTLYDVMSEGMTFKFIPKHFAIVNATIFLSKKIQSECIQERKVIHLYLLHVYRSEIRAGEEGATETFVYVSIERAIDRLLAELRAKSEGDCVRLYESTGIFDGQITWSWMKEVNTEFEPRN